MTKYLFPIILVSALIISILNIPGECQKPAFQDPQSKGGNSGFLLPEKQSSLSYTEGKGQTLYNYYCALCHGATGNGDGFNSYTLTSKPAKLADPALIARLSDAQIMEVIKKGGRALGLSPSMPSWDDLFKAQDITALSAYIRTFSKAGSHSNK
jgi:mono/diheme cytochrome c family protein